MKLGIIILISLFLKAFQVVLYAQPNSEIFIQEADSLYKQGHLQEAAVKYESALYANENNSTLIIKLAQIFYDQKKYHEAIEFSEMVIKINQNEILEAFFIEASSYAALDLFNEVDQVWSNAEKKIPKSKDLFHKQALMYSDFEMYDKAINAALIVAEKDPSFAENHFLIGMCAYNSGLRIKCILALYQYLLLKPQGELAASALQTIKEMFGLGIEKDGEARVNIFVSPKQGDQDFMLTEFMIPIIFAGKLSDENKDKSDAEIFGINNQTFFGILEYDKRKKKNIWNSYYSKFYKELSEKGFAVAFSYYIKQSEQQEEVMGWLIENETNVESMLKWVKEFQE